MRTDTPRRSIVNPTTSQCFECPSEISAGLAYLTCMAPELELDRAFEHPILSASAHSLLEALQKERRANFAEGRFNDRYQLILESGVLRPWRGVLQRAEAELSRACLEVFHVTHDFFALHLVTGSHAYRGRGLEQKPCTGSVSRRATSPSGRRRSRRSRPRTCGRRSPASPARATSTTSSSRTRAACCHGRWVTRRIWRWRPRI